MNVEVENIGQLVKDLHKYSDEVKKELSNQTERSARKVQRSAMNKVRVDVGDLRASIRVRTNQIEGEVYTDKKHAPYEEFGTGRYVKIPPGLGDVASQFQGGKGGGFDELLKSIKRWVKAKGIEEGAAFPIAMKIAKYGREGQAFMYPAAEEERRPYLQAVKRILKK